MLTTRELLNEDDANLVLKHGFDVYDAEALLAYAPLNIVQRIAHFNGKIDYVTIVESGDPHEAWALTMPNTSELMSAWINDWLCAFTDEVVL